MKQDSTLIKHKYLLNIEQLTVQLRRIKSACYKYNFKIIDYNIYNSKLLNPSSLYMPFISSQNEISNLQQLVKSSEKLYDFAFCSADTQRRTKIYEVLNSKFKCVNIKCFGLSRDKLIAQSKVLINIHKFVNLKIYEHLRCDRWLFAGLPIISEKSMGEEELDIKNLLVIDTYDNLIDVATNYINNYDENYKIFKDNYDKNINDIILNRQQILKNLGDVLQNT
jgi:hypothetical protein